MFKVFIDGSAGTTGLRIYERLSERDDIELIKIDEEDRKKLDVRKAAIESADAAFLCLPDSAAIEIVETLERLVCGGDCTVFDFGRKTENRLYTRRFFGRGELYDSHGKRQNGISFGDCVFRAENGERF